MTNGDLPRREITVDPVLAVAIAAAIFCCVFFHGYEVFQYTLSIDEELMLWPINPLQYIQLGRWGGFLLSWLRTPLPVTSMMAGLTLYSTAFVLLMRQFQIKNWELVIVASGFFFGFPDPPPRLCLQQSDADDRVGNADCRIGTPRRQREKRREISPRGFVGSLERRDLSVVLLSCARYLPRGSCQADLARRRLRLEWRVAPTCLARRRRCLWAASLRDCRCRPPEGFQSAARLRSGLRQARDVGRTPARHSEDQRTARLEPVQRPRRHVRRV